MKAKKRASELRRLFFCRCAIFFLWGSKKAGEQWKAQTLSPVGDTTPQSFCSFGAKIQLPFNKERSSVIYRSKGGKAAYGWCKAPIAKCFRRKAAQTFLLKIHRGAEKRSANPRCEPCTGEPRNAPQTLGANLAQGSRETHRKTLGVNFTQGSRELPASRAFSGLPSAKNRDLIRKNYYFWRNYI